MLVFVAFVEDFNDSEITRTVSQLVLGAQSDYEVLLDSLGHALFSEGFFFEDNVIGIISQADDKGAPGGNDVVQQFIFGVSGIDEIDADADVVIFITAFAMYFMEFII